ncbi:hypothetical protein DFH08DRAFT_843917 [Mycena albidolilacea]|uniref:Uncharacterized protein n=1 Tax=Mycena albidolilacea TaxID=1033008 RepID=A0AAD7AKJ4_9AGAR|nr:hypothetical protein DFH08DRAFT_843917 [Mycena albidolilacea]
MSSDKASDKPNPTQLTASIEQDIAELNELLSKETLDDAGEASVAELLARLESADGVAKGVETKLDALLGNLDSLLAALEEEKADTSVQEGSQQPPATSQSTDEGEKSTDKNKES